MAKKHKPRAGSLGFYPRKKAARETPRFSSAQTVAVFKEAKPLNFIGYKVGMTHIIGKDSHEKGATFGQNINIPVTVIETPALRIFGVRAYGKAEKGYGIGAVFDIFAEKQDKSILRKLTNFKKEKKAGAKKDQEKKKNHNTRKQKQFSDLEAVREKITGIVLLAQTQPGKAGFSKKRPDLTEIALSGNVEQQIAFAKESIGKEISAGDVFSELEFVDVKAVTKGKGMQGVVKRYGVTIQGRKAKTRRIVGSISPWKPATVMWTVPRPGQLGYQSRTELNKKIIKIGESGEEINPKGGFKKYGLVKGEYILLTGSVPGPAKRAVAVRKNVRAIGKEQHKIESINFIATKPQKGKQIEGEEKLLSKVKLKKEEKKEQKSVADEIKEAAEGEKK